MSTQFARNGLRLCRDVSCDFEIPAGVFRITINRFRGFIMRSTLIGSFLVLLLISIACNPFSGVDGSGTPKTETRAVKDFTAISFSGVGKVIIEQTGTESLSVTADDNILPLLESR